MQRIRAVGREAAAKKYDILSAMMAHALAGDAQDQRLVLRLMALITTRYNWQGNELAVGQREIARLWCVDERTVKRDMARLRASGWITVKRQGARGRVSVLGLDLDRILLDTRPRWANIGPDYVARMAGADPQPAADTTVVPFRRPDMAAAEGAWSAARAQLASEDRALFDAWFACLADGGVEDGCLVLIAPSRFHAAYLRTHLIDRLRVAVRRADGRIGQIRIEAG
ncbi:MULTISPECIES: DnaA N-terminal domain-containing protein [Paracoccus]|uniref:DnaA N-terminal domain-containing protein n=1 Tax=Paracoccus fontiphilus TaxID=1815556 RepID=A0ABV7IHF0_9RHOB|nr:DnaA N-terminal domain-containing protein [Paracoccus fontiphilus]